MLAIKRMCFMKSVNLLSRSNSEASNASLVDLSIFVAFVVAILNLRKRAGRAKHALLILSKNRQADKFTWRFPSACLPGFGARIAAPKSMGKGSKLSFQTLRQSIAKPSPVSILPSDSYRTPVFIPDSWLLAQ